MNIPNEIVEAIELLPRADRGAAYCAVITYIRDEQEPDADTLTPIAQAFFIMAKAFLRPRIRRRKAAARRRSLNKSSLTTKSSTVDKTIIPDGIIQPTVNLASDTTIPIKLSRAERRRLERLRRKSA